MILRFPIAMRGAGFLLAFLLLLSACDNGSQKPITTDEAKKFAQEIELSIEKRDPDLMNKLVDRDEVVKRAGLKGSKNERDFGEGVKKSANMGSKVVESISKTGTYELVKIYEKEGKQHAIFRLYDDGSINYHDMELHRKKGEIRIADIFIYTTGETLSATIKALYEQFAGLIDKAGPEEEWLRSMPKIRQYITQEKYQEAYDIFMSIPETGRKGKAFMIVKVEICSGLSDEMHQQAIDELIAAFPNEPNMQLILFDAYFMRKEYDKLLGAINNVDKLINKDPFLDYYRYLCYTVMEKPEQAKQHLLKVCQQYPRFPDAQLELVATYLEEKNYDSARLVVKDFRLRKSFPQERLTELVNVYPDFTEK